MVDSVQQNAQDNPENADEAVVDETVVDKHEQERTRTFTLTFGSYLIVLCLAVVIGAVIVMAM